MVSQLKFKQFAFTYPKLPLQTPHCLGTGVGLHSQTGLVEEVRVPGGEVGSTVDISWARPCAGTVSCPVAELKASEASCAIHVNLSAAWK